MSIPDSWYPITTTYDDYNDEDAKCSYCGAKFKYDAPILNIADHDIDCPMNRLGPNYRYSFKGKDEEEKISL